MSVTALLRCPRAVLGFSSCCLGGSKYQFAQFHIASSSDLPTDESTALGENVSPWLFDEPSTLRH